MKRTKINSEKLGFVLFKPAKYLAAVAAAVLDNVQMQAGLETQKMTVSCCESANPLSEHQKSINLLSQNLTKKIEITNNMNIDR